MFSSSCWVLSTSCTPYAPSSSLCLYLDFAVAQMVSAGSPLSPLLLHTSLLLCPLHDVLSRIPPCSLQLSLLAPFLPRPPLIPPTWNLLLYLLYSFPRTAWGHRRKSRKPLPHSQSGFPPYSLKTIQQEATHASCPKSPSSSQNLSSASQKTQCPNPAIYKRAPPLTAHLLTLSA